MGQLRRQVGRELGGPKSPPPVAAVEAGSIHARFAAEAEYVLQRRDAQAGNGRLCGADEGPVNAVIAAAHIGFGVAAFVLGGGGVPPSDGGIVVMSAGVDDSFVVAAMGQIHVRAFVSEAELEHGHARNLQALAQRVDFRRDVAEVFGEERQSAEGFTQFVEEVVFGSIDPASTDRGGVCTRYLPELVESAEVIEADVVAVVGGPAQALDPPLVAAGLHDVPAVERIAPALSGLAEKIWGDAGDDFGTQIFVEAEQVGLSPDIGAVVVDEDGDVANDADGALRTVAAQGPPLFVEGELQGAADFELDGKFFPKFIQSDGIAMGKIVGPLIPAFQFLVSANRVEQDEIIEPPGIAGAEAVEAVAG